MRNILFALALLAVAGCGTGSPTWHPAGYAYHNDFYKAQPGPEASSIGYTYTPERNAVAVNTWQMAARLLIDQMETRLGIAPQSVYLQMIPKYNAFNSSFDYALREELRMRGYVLEARSRNATLQLYPEAYDAPTPKRSPEYGYSQGLFVGPPVRNPREFILGLTPVKNNAALGTVKHAFLIPAYGYVPGSGRFPLPETVLPFSDHPVPAPSHRMEPDTGPQPLIPDSSELQIIEERL